MARDEGKIINHWQSDGLKAEVQMEWEEVVEISKVEIKCDTNVRRNIMLRKDSKNDDKFSNTVPPELLKSLELYGRVKGVWVKLGELINNEKRLIKFNFNKVKTTAIKLSLKDTYGSKNIRLHEIRCYES